MLFVSAPWRGRLERSWFDTLLFYREQIHTPKRCPQCHEQFNAPAKAKPQTLCPACSAFEGLVADTAPKKRRRGFFSAKENAGDSTAALTASVEDPQDTLQSHTVYPTCENCDGRLVSAAKKTNVFVRWFRELIHFGIAAALFPILPPYGAILGIVYFLIASRLENRVKVFTICQQCGQEIEFNSRKAAKESR